MVMRLIGRALRGVRPGLDATVLPGLGARAGRMRMESEAFADGQRIPVRLTADGEGLSPPLAWAGVPGKAASLALVVEDADSPFPRPIVHLILAGIDPARRMMVEGLVSGGRAGEALVGRNSFARAAWLPPAPIPGHGPHRYVFQLLALDTVPDFTQTPGKRQFLAAVRGHVLAGARLVGIYERA